MTIQRSAIRGCTDYTGAPLEDIYQHLGEWRESTQELVSKLESYRLQVVKNEKRIDNVDEVLDFILLSSDLFTASKPACTPAADPQRR
jgi:hypothetical protein